MSSCLDEEKSCLENMPPISDVDTEGYHTYDEHDDEFTGVDDLHPPTDELEDVEGHKTLEQDVDDNLRYGTEYPEQITEGEQESASQPLPNRPRPKTNIKFYRGVPFDSNMENFMEFESKDALDEFLEDYHVPELDQLNLSYQRQEIQIRAHLHVESFRQQNVNFVRVENPSYDGADSVLYGWVTNATYINDKMTSIDWLVDEWYTNYFNVEFSKCTVSQAHEDFEDPTHGTLTNSKLPDFFVPENFSSGNPHVVDAHDAMAHPMLNWLVIKFQYSQSQASADDASALEQAQADLATAQQNLEEYEQNLKDTDEEVEKQADQVTQQETEADPFYETDGVTDTLHALQTQDFGITDNIENLYSRDNEDNHGLASGSLYLRLFTMVTYKRTGDDGIDATEQTGTTQWGSYINKYIKPVIDDIVSLADGIHDQVTGLASATNTTAVDRYIAKYRKVPDAIDKAINELTRLKATLDTELPILLNNTNLRQATKGGKPSVYDNITYWISEELMETGGQITALLDDLEEERNAWYDSFSDEVKQQNDAIAGEVADNESVGDAKKEELQGKIDDAQAKVDSAQAKVDSWDSAQKLAQIASLITSDIGITEQVGYITIPFINDNVVRLKQTGMGGAEFNFLEESTSLSALLANLSVNFKIDASSILAVYVKPYIGLNFTDEDLTMDAQGQYTLDIGIRASRTYPFWVPFADGQRDDSGVFVPFDPQKLIDLAGDLFTIPSVGLLPVLNYLPNADLEENLISVDNASQTSEGDEITLYQFIKKAFQEHLAKDDSLSTMDAWTDPKAKEEILGYMQNTEGFIPKLAHYFSLTLTDGDTPIASFQLDDLKSHYNYAGVNHSLKCLYKSTPQEFSRVDFWVKPFSDIDIQQVGHSQTLVETDVSQALAQYTSGHMTNPSVYNKQNTIAFALDSYKQQEYLNRNSWQQQLNNADYSKENSYLNNSYANNVLATQQGYDRNNQKLQQQYDRTNLNRTQKQENDMISQKQEQGWVSYGLNSTTNLANAVQSSFTESGGIGIAGAVGSSLASSALTGVGQAVANSFQIDNALLQQSQNRANLKVQQSQANALLAQTQQQKAQLNTNSVQFSDYMTGRTYENTLQNIMAGRNDLKLKAPATVSSGSDVSYRFAIGLNKIMVVCTAPSREVLRQMINYWVMFGYKINRYVSDEELKALMHTRNYANFIKTDMCQIKPSVNMQESSKTAIEQLFNRGFTLWHDVDKMINRDYTGNNT